MQSTLLGGCLILLINCQFWVLGEGNQNQRTNSSGYLQPPQRTFGCMKEPPMVLSVVIWPLSENCEPQPYIYGFRTGYLILRTVFMNPKNAPTPTNNWLGFWILMCLCIWIWLSLVVNWCWAVLSFSKKEPVGKGRVHEPFHQLKKQKMRFWPLLDWQFSKLIQLVLTLNQFFREICQFIENFQKPGTRGFLILKIFNIPKLEVLWLLN